MSKIEMEKTAPPWKELIRRAAPYLLTALVCLVCLQIVTGIFSRDWRVPIIYEWDGMLNLAMVKGLTEGAWSPFEAPQFERLGAPFNCSWADLPLGKKTSFTMLWLIGRFTDEPGVVLHVFYLLTFLLPALAFVWAMKRLEIGFASALPPALLFAFLPYHMMRFYAGHLSLATYFFLPLYLVVFARIWSDRPPLFPRSVSLRFSARNRSDFLALAAAVLAGMGSNYYALFFMFFAVVSGAADWVTTRRLSGLCSGGFLAGATALVLLFLQIPYLGAKTSGAFQTNIIKRSAVDVYTYSPTLTELFLPLDGHRLEALARLKAQTAAFIPPGGGNALGIIAVLAVLFLGLRLFLRTRDGELPDKLAVWFGAGFLMASTGGMALLLSVITKPYLRDYTRMTVFLALFALTAAAWLLDRLRPRLTRIGHTLLVLGVAVIGLFDITAPWMRLDNPGTDFVEKYPNGMPGYFRDSDYRDAYTSDKAFISDLEKRLPDGAMVLQLPDVPFFEHPPVNRMKDYSHFRAYVCSDDLRWSYGISKSWAARAKQAEWARMPMPSQIDAMCQVGYAGIYLDRYGYRDGGDSVENQLREILGPPLLESSDKRLVFYDLRGHSEKLKASMSLDAWESTRKTLLSLDQ